MQKVKASMMNAIHDLPLLVARDEGFFRDQGLDVDIIRTPGSGQKDSDHQALRANVFERTMEALYDQGACDQFRMCEWGVMKRAVESNVAQGHRPAKIVALGSAMSTFAIVTDPKARIYEPEQLKGKPIGVSPFNGSHFTTLKLLEGFLKREQIRTTFAGTMKGTAGGREPWRGGRRQPDGAVDQHRRKTRPSRSHGVALDPQRGRRRRVGRRDAGKNVPRRGLGRRRDPEEPRALRALSDRRGRRSARAEGSQAVADIECRTRAVHPRALRAHLSVDAGMGAGCAGRHVREHGG